MRRNKQRDNMVKTHYKGVLKQTKNNAPYTFNDLLEELRGNNLSRLSPPSYKITVKKIVKKYIENEIEKINDTDEFL